jgi:hypothetical protein
LPQIVLRPCNIANRRVRQFSNAIDGQRQSV